MAVQEHKVLAVLFGATICFGGVVALAIGRFSARDTPASPQLLSAASSVVLGDLPPEKSPYTLVEFMDYECPPCRSVASALPKTLAPYKNKVALRTRNLPLNQHPYAMQAAVTAEAAREQGKFEPVRDALRTQELSSPAINSIVSQNHLDKVRFQADIIGSAKNRVAKDIADAHTIGINATPSFVLCCPDGKVFQLSSLKQLDQLVK